MIGIFLFFMGGILLFLLIPLTCLIGALFCAGLVNSTRDSSLPALTSVIWFLRWVAFLAYAALVVSLLVMAASDCSAAPFF